VLDVPVRHKDGHLIAIDVRRSRFDIGPDPLTIFALRDVSERREAEDARLRIATAEAMRIEAEHANQLKDQFLSTAAHELKTPVAVITAYAQLLARRMAAESPAPGALSAEAVTVIVRQCERLARLVEDLLETSRLTLGSVALRRERLRLGALVGGVAARTQRLTDQHAIGLTLMADPNVDADTDRIEQVVTNLLSNAIKFSPNGGPITVTVDYHPSDGQAVVVVQDHGVGIAPERQARIFDQFYRAHEDDARFGGMGLGLFLSREIVRRHGGRVWLSSVAGEGTTVGFSLPAVTDPITDAKPRAPRRLGEPEAGSDA
jgi:signal transduction histidine kinase